MKLFWVLVTCCFFGNVTFASTEGEKSRSANVQVLFVNPGFSDESFWGDVDKYAIAAAQSLDIQLEIIHGQRDRILTQQKLAERMKKAPEPDFVILVNEKGSGQNLLEPIAPRASKVTFALNDLTASEKRIIYANPKYAHRLLPGVFPNNYNIGYLSAQSLFSSGGSVPGDFVLISGDKNTPASINREAGATSFIMQEERVSLSQRVYGDWQESIAYEQAKVLLNRHKDIRYLWTANDHMAFGAIRALEDAGLEAGEDVFIGTINTSAEVLNALAQKQIASLSGGHFTAVGLALVKIYHYANGEPWPQRTKYNLFQPIMYPSDLFDIIKQKDWNNIDFKRIDIRANPINPFSPQLGEAQ
ncbi:periplasmic sugar-binding domain protein [Vibrio variabilis]|uniref:Autoinducer 2-binding periplasmic protein LuxP n=1 Tax=Vibrio variabilis TaxID=990271 RepID=A0ABQ0J7A8_9VIBR|nr:periplasmic sugar-binding domain protein [Vibrio variabilis]